MNKCFLFDNDGTLVDSERLCNLGLVIMFKDLGITLDADELVNRFRGWKLATALTALEQEYEISLVESFIPQYRLLVSDLFIKNLKPIDGVVEALESIDSPKAVVSSGPIEKIKQSLNLCGLSKYFEDHIFSSYDVGIWKPDPGIYLHAAKEMGYSPNQCVVIEDSPVGVQAGIEAGMQTFFFNRFNEECKNTDAISFDLMASLAGLVKSHS